MSQEEFNALSQRLPVLVNMRGRSARYSMVDIDAKGGLAVIVQGAARRRAARRRLPHLHRRDAGRAGRAARRRPRPTATSIHPVARTVQADGRSPPAAGQPRPRRRRHPQGGGRRGRHRTDGRFTGPRPRLRQRAATLIERAGGDAGRLRRTATWSSSATRGRAARPGCRRSSTRPRASPRCAAASDITIALMTDARFSGGSVGLVIGHVAPEAYLGGPIALIEDGDTIVVDLNKDRLDCRELADEAVRARRARRLAGGGAAARGRAPGREAGDEPAPPAHALRGAPRAGRRGDGDRLAAAPRRGVPSSVS